MPSAINVALGARLVAERERLELSQTALAHSLGVARNTVMRWEKGTPIPSDHVCEMLHLGFDLWYLFTGHAGPVLVSKQRQAERDVGGGLTDQEVVLLLICRAMNEAGQRRVFEVVRALAVSEGLDPDQIIKAASDFDLGEFVALADQRRGGAEEIGSE